MDFGSRDDPMKHIQCALLLGCLGAALTGGAALAQQAIAPSVEPEALRRRIEPQRFPDRQEVTPAPSVRVPIIYKAPVGSENVKFTLNGIRIVREGTSSHEPPFDDGDFKSVYADKVGTMVSIADIFGFANDITRRYGDAGYFLSFAYLAPQEIKDGIVEIRIIEGHIDSVEFALSETNALGYRTDIIKGTKRHILESRPLNAGDFDRSILLLNDLPGMKATANVGKSDQFGAAKTDIQLTRKPVSASLSVDNRGTKSIGPLESTATVQLNSLFGLQERTTAAFSTTPGNRELRYGYIGQQHVISSEGTTVGVSFDRLSSHPGSEYKTTQVETSGTTARVVVTHPLIRSRQQNLSVEGGFTWKNSQIDQIGQPFTRDRIRYLSAGANYGIEEATGAKNWFELFLHQGVKGFGASSNDNPLRSRLYGRVDFTKMNATLGRNQPISENWSIAGTASGQYAFHSLLSSQQFSLGGEPFGRAYDSSEIVGDSGYGGSLEIRYRPDIEIPHVDFLQAFAFIDHGKVFQRTPINQPKTSSLTSAGVGVRFAVGEYLSGSVEADKPISRRVASGDSKDTRAFFRIVAQY